MRNSGDHFWELSQKLDEYARVALVGEDPEGIHQVRVLTRRLRVLLRLIGYRVLHDDLRWLASQISDVRDLDVQIDKAPCLPYREWLIDQRKGKAPLVHRVLTSGRFAGIVVACKGIGNININMRKRERKKELKKLVKRVNKLDLDAAHDDDIHGVRKSLRRVRYTREFFGKKVSDIKELQDSFGAFNDICVGLRWWERFPDKQRFPDVTERFTQEYVRLRAGCLDMLEEKKENILS